MPHDSLNGRRILLVEDDPDGLELLQMVFEAEGATVVGTASGEQALAVWDREEFDVVVSDVSMPGMSGLECMRALRARGERGRAVAALAVSGNATPRDVQNAREAGFDDFLPKPVDIDALVGRVRCASQRTVRTALGGPAPSHR